MEAFDYIAIDRGGSKSKGTLNAPSARDARDMLRIRNLTPLDLKPAKAAAKKGEKVSGRLKPAHRVQATRQLAILIGASQPIEEALRVVAQGFETSPLRQILLDVRTRVMEGARLSQALAAHPKAFPEFYTSMVASGEGSGTLPKVLERLASDLESAQAIRRKILSATIYPIVLLVVAMLVVAILMVFVVPNVVAQFADFGQELPLLTRFVIGASDFVKLFGLPLVAGIVFAIWTFRQARRRNEALDRKWSGFILGLPLVGKLVRSVNAARFARTLGSLLNAGTPSVAAMDTAKFTLSNSTMRAATARAVERVREGSSVSRALARAEVFPPLVVQMVAGGEASDNIADMFDRSADYLEDEFEGFTAVFLALLEPLLIILLSVIVLVVIAAIFLPILQLQMTVI